MIKIWRCGMARRTNAKAKDVNSANIKIAPKRKADLKVAQEPIVK